MLNVLYLAEGSTFAGAESYLLSLVQGILTLQKCSTVFGLFYSGPLRERLQEKGLKVFELFGKDNLRSIRFLIRYVRENHIDIVHLLDLKSTIIWGIVGLFAGNVKTIATIHGIPESYDSFYMRMKFGFSMALYFLVLRLAVDRILCVSKDLANQLRERIGRRKVRVVHNGIDLKRVDKACPVHLSKDNHPIIGTVGRLDRVKDHSLLLESAALILNAGHDAVFYIVGTGPLEKDLRKQAALLGITNKVRFWGFRSDVLDLTASMNVFVLTSLHEGIPYALLEAMSLSKAVVCTRVGGLTEVLEDGVDGILVHPKDQKAMSEAVMALLNDPGYASTLGRRARKRIEEQFSLDEMATKTYTIYEEMLRDLS